ncbi:MAG: hypothetical protein CVU65_05455 [Deltaproteobacteria bacterium HGW-Deltaproteobacteria-22]|jgi:hypothetical protein|nr:MAG: hypothetical protein CVU65_05455 [Deltaproteobacteria bacterium HGW-Deltaproteobacteria-22]
MKLHEQLERVTDQESFMAFARALAQDRASAVQAEAKSPASHYGADAGGWENTSIEAFLEAAVAWAEDSNFGTTQGLATVSPWRKFAVFLYCGKIYE